MRREKAPCKGKSGRSCGPHSHHTCRQIKTTGAETLGCKTVPSYIVSLPETKAPKPAWVLAEHPPGIQTSPGFSPQPQSRTVQHAKSIAGEVISNLRAGHLGPTAESKALAFPEEGKKAFNHFHPLFPPLKSIHSKDENENGGATFLHPPIKILLKRGSCHFFGKLPALQFSENSLPPRTE